MNEQSLFQDIPAKCQGPGSPCRGVVTGHGCVFIDGRPARGTPTWQHYLSPFRWSSHLLCKASKSPRGCARARTSSMSVREENDDKASAKRNQPSNNQFLKHFKGWFLSSHAIEGCQASPRASRDPAARGPCLVKAFCNLASSMCQTSSDQAATSKCDAAAWA